jgi:hypothetical protein
MHVKFSNVIIIVLLGLICTGCSLSYNLNPPISSTALYDQDKEERKIIHIIDNRVDKQFSQGIGPLKDIDIKIGNVEDPIVWFAESLQNEFTARGISIEITTEKPTPNSPHLVLTINKYQIISSRKSGFHPYIAYHSFAGTLQAPAVDNKIMAYFLYGKTPVWSMDEVQEPCFNMPASVLVKEIAAKINRLALNHRMSDRQVEELNILVEKQIKASSPDTYLTVLDLGESNNPKAMAYLVKLADNDDLIIRASALSAIGMLGPESKLAFLKDKYAQYRDIDRFMAIKSIGDIGTPEALEFLKNAQYDPQYNEEYGFKFGTDLYIEAAKQE